MSNLMMFLFRCITWHKNCKLYSVHCTADRHVGLLCECLNCCSIIWNMLIYTLVVILIALSMVLQCFVSVYLWRLYFPEPYHQLSGVERIYGKEFYHLLLCLLTILQCCVHLSMCVQVAVCVQVSLCAGVCAHISVCSGVCVFKCQYVQLSVCSAVCMFTCLCVHLCVFRLSV